MKKYILNNLVDIFLGVTHTPEYVTEGIPFLSVKDISSGIIDFANCKYISKKEYDSLSEGAKPKAGDMLFCRVGTLGKPIIIPEGTPLFGSFVSLGYLRNKDASICNMNYLRYWMNSNSFWLQVQANVNGASQVNLNTGWLSKFVLDLPKMNEQQYRIDLLDRISLIISTRQQELQKLDELVKSRFVEMFGDSKYPTKTLIDIIKDGAGLSYGIVVPGENTPNGVPMVRPSDFKNGKLDISNMYRVNFEIEKKYSRTRLIGDEILVQVIGQPGQVMLTTHECKGMNVTRNLAVIRPNQEIVNRIYLKEYIEKEESQRFLLKSAKQSTLKQLPLNLLKQLEVQLPPYELQNQFAAFVSQIDKSKLAVQKALDEAQLLFDSLMQKYFG